MRGFLDRDFIETVEGFLFCVVGPFHPKDRVISYLKYVPDERGTWGKKRKRFKRVMKAYTISNLLETFKLLEKSYSHYLFHSRFYNIRMTAVPYEKIRRHYRPEEKLRGLFKSKELDALQTKALEFVRTLSKASGVSSSSFGVTGSILLEIHSLDFSDLDLTIYGLKNTLAVKECLNQLYFSCSKIRRFEGKRLEAWCKSKTMKHPLSFSEAKTIYERRWNIGTFDGTPFSIHPVKTKFELSEKYGDKSFHPRGFVTVRATVEEDSDSMFLPAVYRVRNAEVLEGPKTENILEIVSYESLYDSLAAKGEVISARGKLEVVENLKNGDVYHRVLVGSPEGRGKEFIKPG